VSNDAPVIREFHGRTLVCCDKCPVRLDLGLTLAVRARNRTPSGWISAGTNLHYCPLCSPHMTTPAIFQAAGARRRQPLV
jgi:hypothetical protein